jgi:hypothetical protein
MKVISKGYRKEIKGTTLILMSKWYVLVILLIGFLGYEWIITMC